MTGRFPVVRAAPFALEDDQGCSNRRCKLNCFYVKTYLNSNSSRFEVLLSSEAFPNWLEIHHTWNQIFFFQQDIFKVRNKSVFSQLLNFFLSFFILFSRDWKIFLKKIKIPPSVSILKILVAIKATITSRKCPIYQAFAKKFESTDQKYLTL